MYWVVVSGNGCVSREFGSLLSSATSSRDSPCSKLSKREMCNKVICCECVSFFFFFVFCWHRKFIGLRWLKSFWRWCLQFAFDFVISILKVKRNRSNQKNHFIWLLIFVAFQQPLLYFRFVYITFSVFFSLFTFTGCTFQKLLHGSTLFVCHVLGIFCIYKPVAYVIACFNKIEWSKHMHTLTLTFACEHKCSLSLLFQA